MLPLRAFKMSLSPKLLMEVVAARLGIGGKGFPGISCLVVRRGPAVLLPLFSLPVDEERE